MRSGEDQAQGNSGTQDHRSGERPADKYSYFDMALSIILVATYSYKSKAQTREHQRADDGEDLITSIGEFVWITIIIAIFFILHLHLLPLKHVSEGFLTWEGFGVGHPKQEQGPGESQADGEDQSCSLQTKAAGVADVVVAVAVVVALIFLELQSDQ